MDTYDVDADNVVVAPPSLAAESPVKDWRLKYQAGTLAPKDFIDFFTKNARKHLKIEYMTSEDSIRNSLRCYFDEQQAKESIIDKLLAFVFGDNPTQLMKQLAVEGNTAAICGKVFKNGEPTYSCRECGLDPTCVLCVHCFKQSAHRRHKYKMSTSGGGGCCDCGDEEAWKRDCYCEEHLRRKEHPIESALLTQAMEERLTVIYKAILTFCVNYLEMESNASLQCLDGDSDGDHFCTVLYNDESHTFDQVIQTLTKIAKCRQKDAMEIVASIDREGRAVVKCDSFYECSQLKEQIEKQSMSVVGGVVPTLRGQQSLRVSVLHQCGVACQQFALNLLTWFQEFLTQHATYRAIFAQTVLDKKAPYSIGHILDNDVKLWKTARTCWHRLLISGMLKEYSIKKSLAQEFSRHYATMVQDFIRDDHEHSFSVISLSVQLFTVPSIAQYLIANESIFHKLLHTFYHESIEKYINNKTLHFAKNMTSLGFIKRAAYILYDLKYILSFKPDVWTPDLRQGFLDGCKALLRLLNVMQGMESVQRQTGQHMDYEPEWECAFNLHIKLASTITLAIEWSATDREVLTKLYQMTMRYLVNNGFILNNLLLEKQTVAGHEANCLMYDVASKPVSVHLPLTRLFAGIYINLGKYNMTFDNVITTAKRTPEEIIEPILCTQAMMAQVHSGMWRRNGYSLLHQLYFYRNVRCRIEMLDRDIVALQIGAALIESNQFLIHILNKFKLIEWTKPNYDSQLTASTTDDDIVKQLSIIDELLELLIVIVNERYVPGISEVTDEDRIKKEIMQLLCIKSFSHSELSRALPDSNNEMVLEDLIKEVAVFNKPQQKSDTKGVYVLKEELHDDYNMYFYHYTKEEKSKSEEAQRTRRQKNEQLVCCPPPKLPKLTKEFVSIANVLQCDVMLSIMNIVLSRALDPKSKSFQDSHLQKVLHLIGCALQEEQSQNYAFLSFCERSKNFEILAKLEELSRTKRAEANRDFLLWTVNKFKELQPSSEMNASSSVAVDDTANTQMDESEPELSNAEKERKEKAYRLRMAQERRAQLMAQMQKAQQSFMQSNLEVFSQTNLESPSAPTQMDWQENAMGPKQVACLGYDKCSPQPQDPNMKCILCFEDCVPSMSGPAVVYPAFVQKSTVLGVSKNYPYHLHTSSCGHIIHASCWQEYYNNEESRDQRRSFRHRSLINGQNTEFLCPYCRCLSNTVLPLTVSLSQFNLTKATTNNAAQISVLEFANLMHLVGKLDCVVEQEDSFLDLKKVLESFNQLVCTEPPELNAQWFEYLEENFSKILRNFKSPSTDKTPTLHLMVESCVYSVRSLEVYLRATQKTMKDDLSIRHNSCLSSLVRICSLYSTKTEVKVDETTRELANRVLNTLFSFDANCLLQWDCFGLVVQFMFMVPNIVFNYNKSTCYLNTGDLLEHYAVVWGFIASVVKAIILCPLIAESEESSMDVDEESENDYVALPTDVRQNILNFYMKNNFARLRKLKKDQPKAAEAQLATQDSQNEAKIIARLFAHVRSEMLEYLRCTCLLCHFITDVEFPAEFATLEGESYENMCKYLGIESKLETYFSANSGIMALMDRFTKSPEFDKFKEDNMSNKGDLKSVEPCTHAVPQLANLPEDYSDLINSVSDLTCPNNEREEMKSPTMCMVCEKILCGQSYCCQPEMEPSRSVGACTFHTYNCGQDIGMFLRIRDCHVIFLGHHKGCFATPPYLDEYGEADQGLRRGNPLHLSREHYKKLQLTWLAHELHEEISRSNENAQSSITQWHHM